MVHVQIAVALRRPSLRNFVHTNCCNEAHSVGLGCHPKFSPIERTTYGLRRDVASWTQAVVRRRGSHSVYAMRSQMTLRSSLLASRCLPPGRALLFLCVTASVDLRVAMQLEELGELKNPLISRIEPTTFRFVT
jgi:hypothetical protein